jgi:hypothetical protein
MIYHKSNGDFRGTSILGGQKEDNGMICSITHIILSYINPTSKQKGVWLIYEIHIYETQMHGFHTLCVLV